MGKLKIYIVEYILCYLGLKIQKRKRRGIQFHADGGYERNEIKPSIDTAAKIAEALNVTIDYLVKDAEYQNIDDETLKRMKNIEKLTPEDKSHV